jgi:L-alanine-DL-glutamate epimerase-like enolase superfamily enzyme
VARKLDEQGNLINPPLLIRELRIQPLAIPMRITFEHAAASRNTADPVVLRFTAANPFAEHVGYGEAIARPYVTGETVETVVKDIETHFAPLLAAFRPRSFAEALEFIEALPFEDEGRLMTAARGAVELTLIDLAGRVFRRRAAELAGWLELPGFGEPGALPKASYSGIVIGKSRSKIRRMLWLQRLYGLVDFKIKVATEGWQERLIWTHEYLRKPLDAGRVTLRADANGVWSLSDAHEAVELLERCGVSVLEQPLPESLDEDLPWLAEQTTCHLMADESLVTLEDAKRLLETRATRVLNIRITKVGGLLPALRMARLAQVHKADVQLGCLVGETSILGAAGVAFLEMCPRVRFVEGAFGTFLAHGDVTRKRVQFGYGGGIRKRRGFGLGLNVDDRLLEKYAATSASIVRFES